MSGRNGTFKISGSGPAASLQAVVGKPMGGLDEYSTFTIYAEVTNPAGGTVDLYIQRKLETDCWVDWIHFAQVASNTAVKFVAGSDQVTGTAPVAVGKTDDLGTTGAPALAAATVAPGHPGDTVRAIAVTGAGAVAATIVVRIDATRPDW